jgi:hypothetical protein
MKALTCGQALDAVAKGYVVIRLDDINEPHERAYLLVDDAGLFWAIGDPRRTEPSATFSAILNKDDLQAKWRVVPAPRRKKTPA